MIANHQVLLCPLFFSSISILYIFGRFFEMVNSITEEIGKNTEEGECDGDSLEVKATMYSSYFSYFKKLSSLASSTSYP